MSKPRLIVGLTGGIGSGKSEVSRRFSALGVVVVDADEIAREVVRPGEPALEEIVHHFGKIILTAEGTLDRNRLRDIIFSDPVQKNWLENCLHPRINTLVRSRLVAAISPYVILTSPLLLETNQYQLVDRILAIDTSETQQIIRASQRDQKSQEQIRAIMATQINRQERLARAHDVISNNSDLSDLSHQVARLHEYYLSLAKNT